MRTAAGRRVLVGETSSRTRPARARSPPCRTGRSTWPARSWLRRRRDVLEHSEAMIRSKAVGNGRWRASPGRPHPGASASSSRRRHGPKVSRTRPLVVAGVEATTLAPACRLEGVAAEAHPSRASVAGPQATVVVDVSISRPSGAMALGAGSGRQRARLVALGVPSPSPSVNGAARAASAGRAGTQLGSSSSRPMASARAPGSSGATRRPVSRRADHSGVPAVVATRARARHGLDGR